MVYILLPFISAAFYGLSYVLLEKLLQSVSLLTFMFTSCFCMVITVGIFSAFRPDMISLDFVQDKKVLLMFAAAILVGIAGWIGTLIGLQNSSATYVAFAEISYPIFTILFLFLLFGEFQFTWHSLLGGILILAGSVVLVLSQIYFGKS